MPREFSKTVYITVPEETARKAANMTKITKDVLGKLGCLGCHSGFYLKFLIEKNQEMFKYNADLEGKQSQF
jgi:hypothetical protein